MRAFPSQLSLLLLFGLFVGPLSGAEESVIEISRHDLSLRFAGQLRAKSVEIPSGETLISFKTGADGPPTLERFLFKLEGHDTEWREADRQGSFMRVAIAFYDGQGNWIGQNDFPVSGSSHGWNGNMETAPLVPRRELVVIPKGAQKFGVLVSSSGAPEVIGVLAVGALSISKPGLSEPPWHFNIPESGAHLEATEWTRSGNRPGIAQLVLSRNAPEGRLLAVVDEDLVAHGEWQTRQTPLGSTGETLQLEWSQAFSIGMGGDHTFRYKNLEAGRYLFRYKKLNAFGAPIGVEKLIAFEVVPPFWQRTWFLVLTGMALAGVIFGAQRYRSWKRTQGEIAALRQQNAIEAERARIARDIHDDLGSSLTHISMLSEPTDSLAFSEIKENLARINQTAREMTQAMDEIVWALNPKNDQLERLVTFLDAHAQEFLSCAGIDSYCEYPPNIPERLVPAAKRHNLFLAFKEALANAVHHSGCKSVRIHLFLEHRTLRIAVEDDGAGFSQAKRHKGNGLMNMRHRMEDLGGQCSIESKPGAGTKVVLEMPF